MAAAILSTSIFRFSLMETRTVSTPWIDRVHWSLATLNFLSQTA